MHNSVRVGVIGLTVKVAEILMHDADVGVASLTIGPGRAGEARVLASITPIDPGIFEGASRTG